MFHGNLVNITQNLLSNPYYSIVMGSRGGNSEMCDKGDGGEKKLSASASVGTMPPTDDFEPIRIGTIVCDP